MYLLLRQCQFCALLSSWSAVFCQASTAACSSLSVCADLLKELLCIVYNVSEGVVVEPAQLRCAAQQLHQAGDDKGLQCWAPAAGKHNA